MQSFFELIRLVNEVLNVKARCLIRQADDRETEADFAFFMQKITWLQHSPARAFRIYLWFDFDMHTVIGWNCYVFRIEAWFQHIGVPVIHRLEKHGKVGKAENSQAHLQDCMVSLVGH